MHRGHPPSGRTYRLDTDMVALGTDPGPERRVMAVPVRHAQVA
jgi:hypothetical protein